MALHEFYSMSTRGTPRVRIAGVFPDTSLTARHRSSTDKNRYSTFHHSARETYSEPQDSNRCSAANETTLPET